MPLAGYNPPIKQVYVIQKIHPSLTLYILKYENSIAINMIKEVCLDRVTLHNYDTKHEPIDDLLNELSKFNGISLKPQ